MRNRLKYILSISVFLIFFINLGVYCLAKKASIDDLYPQIELFCDTITYIRANYVNEVNAKDLIYGALRGMLASLDPYSQFMDPESYKEIKVETKGEFGGLGIEVSIRDGLLTVISPLEDTPAYKAGIKAGDRIVKIDGESTKNITLIDAVKKMRGEPGTDVTLTILREDEGKIFDVKITRNVIKLESIKEVSILEENIGYVRITEFQERTPQDLQKSLEELDKKGMDSLILDLRNNPGGLLNTAVKVADKFLPKDKVIVIIKGRLGKDKKTYKAVEPACIDYPMIVLVNGGSASASEIVAGALQDNKRAIIMGTKTFGKGSVQTVIPLRDKSAIRLTTAKYFTPNGRVIREEGIIPDVIVEYKKPPRPNEVEEKIEKIFEKIEEKKEKKIYDNQLLRAIDLLKGIKAYRSLEKT